MARPTRWRSDDSHAVIANEVLHRHANEAGWARAMPVPIEAIVEQTYGLAIEWAEIQEPPGSKILGALFPDAKTIQLNELHENMFENWVGPYEFTLAHELGHWLYDADPGQGSLLASEPQGFCHWRSTPGLSKDLQRRESNANKLAAAILMPADLVRGADTDDVLAHIREYAAAWGVSMRALEIRLSELGMIDETGGADRFSW